MISDPIPPAPPVISATLLVSGGQRDSVQFVGWRKPSWWRRERGEGMEGR